MSSVRRIKGFRPQMNRFRRSFKRFRLRMKGLLRRINCFRPRMNALLRRMIGFRLSLVDVGNSLGEVGKRMVALRRVNMDDGTRTACPRVFARKPKLRRQAVCVPNYWHWRFSESLCVNIGEW
jgi:hypothetical protein